MKKILALTGGLCVLSSLLAVETESFLHRSYREFINGEFKNVSLSNEGLLQLAPTLVEIADIDEPIVWTAVADKEGNLYLATGNLGKILKVDAQGEVSTIFAPEEILCRALALDSQGNLYVGTSPTGRVYRIVTGQRPEIFFDPEEKYIWDMVVDSEDNLYLATGNAARIYKLPKDFQPGQEPTLWFKANQTHLTTLTWDSQGHLLTSSSPEGILYRITGEGKGFALYNSSAQEIRQIVTMDDGRIYFSIFNAPSKSKEKKSSTASSSKAKVKNSSEKKTDLSPKASPEFKSAEPSGSLIFALDKQGFVEAYWGLQGSQIFDFISHGQKGELLVGTNTQGRLFTVAHRNDWSLLQQPPEGGEVSVLIPHPKEAASTIVITSNPAKVYRLEATLTERGNYQSDLMDAGQIAHWGNLLAVTEEGSPSTADLRTRSGNTEEPDETWSDWEAVETVEDNRKIQSPLGRYLQYEATLTQGVKGESNLGQVRLFYQTKNVAPFIASLRILPVGLQLFEALSAPAKIDLKKLLTEKNPERLLTQESSRQKLQKIGEEGLITVLWKAHDSNGDRLDYHLSIKRGGDDRWVTLAEKLEDPVATINTKGLTEGFYRVKVTASDAPANQADNARIGIRLSDPFLVDNSPPTISLHSQGPIAKRGPIPFTAKDAYSILEAVYYTIDGQSHHSLRPDDGIFDAKKESFTLPLKNLPAGTHSLVLEVYDERGNAAVLTTSFDIEE